MKHILFVCTGNSCRSVMAAGLFKKMMHGREGEYKIGSAGVSAMDGYPPTQETVDVMKADGVDVSDHRSRRLTREMVQDAYKVFVMEKTHKEMILRMMPEAKDKVHLLTDYFPGDEEIGRDVDIPDPIRMSGHFYRNVSSMIHNCLKKIAEDL